MFRAYAPDQDKLVAVKMFRLDLAPDRVHRLVDELRRLIDAKIAHPGIAAPLAAGITGVSAYLAQEFVAGDSLDIVLREHGPAAAADATRVAGQLAGALDYAAAAGIVHGALHPRDVLVSADDARLTGLGVARALERVGVAASIRRPYSSPERAGGGEWDRRADVFSLAALMHEMLWARRLNATGDQAAEGLSELPGASLPVLRQLFARALAERPDDRFETALAFAEGLKQAFPGQPAESARGASGRRRTADPRRTAETLRVTPQVPRLPLDVSDASRAGDADATLPASPQPSEDDDTVPTGAPAPVDDDTVPKTPPALVDDDDTVPATPPAPIDDDDTVPTTPSGPPDDDGTVPTRTVLGADTDATVATGHQPAVDGETVPTVAPAPPSVGGDAGGPPQVSTARATTQGAPIPAVDATNAAGPAAPTGTDRRVSELLLGEAARVGREESPASPVVPVPAAVPPRSTAAMLVLALVCLTVGFVAGYRVASLQHANAPVEPAAAPPSAATGEARDESAERVATATPAGPNAALTGSPDGGAAPSGAVPVAEAAGAAPGGRGPVGAKEPPPAPAVGRLLVRSTPGGARVLVDGRDVGRTPVTLRELARGTYAVRVSRDGYQPQERRVSITAARPSRSITVALTRERAARPAAKERGAAPLRVESRPAGARVFLDGELVGTTPLSLADVGAGEHDVRLELEGYKPWTFSARILAGEPNRVAASLER